MIVLHTMPRIGWGLIAPSPFCLKVEVYLKMVGLPYEPRFTLTTSGAPTSKLPWIEDDGRAIGDSGRIVEHLREKAGDPLGEAALSPDERLRDHLLRRTVEESLYFSLLSERWRDDATRAAYSADLLASLPRLARPLVARIARRTLDRQMWEQGIGRHPTDEAVRRGRADLEAIAGALGDAPFFGGDTPRAIDATVFGSLANLWYVPVDTPLKRAIGDLAPLVPYLERVRGRVLAAG